MIKNKRILIISPFCAWPLTNGSATRTYHIAKHLAKENTIFWSHRKNERPTRLDFECVHIPTTTFRYGQIFNPALLYHLHKIVRSESLDLVKSSHLWSGLHGALLKRTTRVPFIFGNHNVEFERFYRMRNPLWPVIKQLERFVCRSADEVVSVSDVDRHKLVRKFNLDAERVRILENGADVEALQRRQVNIAAVRQQLGLAPSKHLILFFGDFGHFPNLKALDDLRQHIIPQFREHIQDFTFVIAGPGLPPVNRIEDNVQILGFVDDLVALIKGVDLVVAPLTAGSGTRLKILESVACGKRVVSTSIGAEGLMKEAFGDMLHIADDWTEFARMMARLLLESEPAVDLPPDFRESYTWSNIVDRLRFPQAH